MAGTYRHIKVNHSYVAWFHTMQGKGVRKTTEAVARDARAGCPVDKGALIRSIKTRYPGELHGVVEVGTDHWSETEYGSPPHVIRAHGRYSLHDDEGNYFGPVVHHPGTPAQPFLRPALYQRRRL